MFAPPILACRSRVGVEGRYKFMNLFEFLRLFHRRKTNFALNACRKRSKSVGMYQNGHTFFRVMALWFQEKSKTNDLIALFQRR